MTLTSVRIWTPLNAVISLPVLPRFTIEDCLREFLALHPYVSRQVLGDLSDEYGWSLYLCGTLNKTSADVHGDHKPMSLEISSISL
jgi:hypothetical protein